MLDDVRAVAQMKRVGHCTPVLRSRAFGFRGAHRPAGHRRSGIGPTLTEFMPATTQRLVPMRWDDQAVACPLATWIG
jgi:hypothetical protein